MNIPKQSEGFTLQPTEHFQSGDSSDQAFQNYTSILRRRARTIVVTTLLIFGVLATFVLMQMKVYESTAKLVVVTKSSGMGGESDDSILSSLASLRQGRTVETQVESSIAKTFSIRRT